MKEEINKWEFEQQKKLTEIPHIIRNAIKTPDGTIIESRHRHDYKVYKDKNGLEYMVDGGHDYLRRNVHNNHPYEELVVYDTDPFHKIRNSFMWGSYGKEGNESLKMIKLCEMSDEHIKSIIENEFGSKIVRNLFELELKYRKINNISILD